MSRNSAEAPGLHYSGIALVLSGRSELIKQNSRSKDEVFNIGQLPAKYV
jgi:hypothetical protein